MPETALAADARHAQTRRGSDVFDIGHRLASFAVAATSVVNRAGLPAKSAFSSLLALHGPCQPSSPLLAAVAQTPDESGDAQRRNSRDLSKTTLARNRQGVRVLQHIGTKFPGPALSCSPKAEAFKGGRPSTQFDSARAERCLGEWKRASRNRFPRSLCAGPTLRRHQVGIIVHKPGAGAITSRQPSSSPFTARRGMRFIYGAGRKQPFPLALRGEEGRPATPCDNVKTLYRAVRCRTDGNSARMAERAQR